MTWLVIAKLVALALYPVLEFFLGKTDSGSVLGVILNSILSILRSLGIQSSQSQGEKK